MRDRARQKESNARRHRERMANDLDYRMGKLLDSMRHRCLSGKGRKDWQWYGAKNLAVTITVDQLKFLWERDGAARMKAPTVDRIDSNVGYIFENCRFCEHADNLRRMIKTRKPRGKDVNPRVRRWAKKPTPLEQHAAELHAKIDPFRPKRRELPHV